MQGPSTIPGARSNAILLTGQAHLPACQSAAPRKPTHPAGPRHAESVRQADVRHACYSGLGDPLQRTA
jgi:hypothetical protein